MHVASFVVYWQGSSSVSGTEQQHQLVYYSMSPKTAHTHKQRKTRESLTGSSVCFKVRFLASARICFQARRALLGVLRASPSRAPRCLPAATAPRVAATSSYASCTCPLLPAPPGPWPRPQLQTVRVEGHLLRFYVSLSRNKLASGRGRIPTKQSKVQRGKPGIQKVEHVPGIAT